MASRKLLLLLVIGITAVVFGLVGIIGISMTMDRIKAAVPTNSAGQTVLGDKTWDEIIGDASPGSDAPSSESASPAKTASPSPSPSKSPYPVKAGGGLVPFDNRKFTVTEDAVPEAWGAKLLKTFPIGRTFRLKDVTWEMNVRAADDISGKQNGRTLKISDMVGTGTFLELHENGEVVDTAVVVIPGDVTGTGSLDASQVAVLEAAVDDGTLLDGPFFIAGDLDESGVIDDADVRILKQALQDAGEANA